MGTELAPPREPEVLEIVPVEIAKGLDVVRPETIQRQIAMMDAVRHAAIQRTSASQWADFNGKPYLQGSAAGAVAWLLGLSVSQPTYEREDLPGGGFLITASISVEKSGRVWHDHDEATSFDPIAGPRVQELIERGASPQAAERIIESLVKKKAAAGATGRAVSGWLGVRDLSWEDLAALGLRQDEAGGKVKHSAGKRGGAVSAVAIADLAKQAKGSVVAVSGALRGNKSGTTSKGTPYCDLAIRDDSGAAWVRYWNAVPDWYADGAQVAAKIKVGEYQGKPQYTAEHVDRAENPEAPAPSGPGESPQSAADDWENKRERRADNGPF